MHSTLPENVKDEIYEKAGRFANMDKTENGGYINAPYKVVHNDVTYKAFVKIQRHMIGYGRHKGKYEISYVLYVERPAEQVNHGTLHTEKPDDNTKPGGYDNLDLDDRR